MIRQLTLGTIVGGAILFLWSAVSWELLSWHRSAFRSFSNEDTITAAIVTGAPAPGMYSIPGNLESAPNLEKLIKGPFVFAAVRPGAMAPPATMFAGHALIQFAAAFLATLLLLQARGLGFIGRTLFVTGIGLTGGIAAFLPEMTWWSFAPGYTLVNVADLTIGFALAGVALAKMIHGTGGPEGSPVP